MDRSPFGLAPRLSGVRGKRPGLRQRAACGPARAGGPRWRLGDDVRRLRDPHAVRPFSRKALPRGGAGSWLPTLKTDTAQADRQLALKLSRVAVKLTQPSGEVRDELRTQDERAPGELIETARLMAVNVQTIAAAHSAWLGACLMNGEVSRRPPISPVRADEADRGAFHLKRNLRAVRAPALIARGWRHALRLGTAIGRAAGGGAPLAAGSARR